jgi:hypothetical protein
MDRVKITLAAMLPALWLLASGQCFVDGRGGCGDLRSGETAGVNEGGKHRDSNAQCSSELSARRTSSRIGTQPAKGYHPKLEPISGLQFSNHWLFAVSNSQAQGPSALASRWQFDCRAAPQPRAPSLIS